IGDFRLWRVKMHALLIQHGCEAALEVLPTDMEVEAKAEISEHIDEFKRIVLHLANIEVKFKNEDLALLLLTSLPTSYEYFMDTLLYRWEALTLADVMATLNSNEIKERSKAKGGNGEGLYVRGRIGYMDSHQSMGNSRSKYQGGRLKCYICQSEDHLKRNSLNNNRKKSTGYVKKDDQPSSGGLIYDASEVMMVMSSEALLDWIMDSGGSYHMIPKLDLFFDFIEYDGCRVLLGDNMECKIRGIGKVRVQLKYGSSFVLHNVGFIPVLKRNLISIWTLEKDGYTIQLQSGKVNVINGSRIFYLEPEGVISYTLWMAMWWQVSLMLVLKKKAVLCRFGTNDWDKSARRDYRKVKSSKFSSVKKRTTTAGVRIDIIHSENYGVQSSVGIIEFQAAMLESAIRHLQLNNQDTINRTVKDNRMGQEQNQSPRSYAPGEYIYVLLYVDDMLNACKSKAEIGSTKSLLKKEFDIKIDNRKSFKMPLGGHFKLSLKDSPVRDYDVERMSKVPYPNAVGSLMYLMVCTRPDILYPVSVVSRYLPNPGKNHWEALKWILRYLRGTSKVGLVYGTYRGNHVDVTGFVDLDYTKDPDKEAEYMALTEAVKEAIWLRGLMEDLGVELNTVAVNCDNQGAIHLSRNLVIHERTKHINVHSHFIREVLEAKTNEVLKVGTEYNHVDALTKLVSGLKFQHCLELLIVVIC
ncbi:retrovirus-related pol polyprotein from transposon TNT 1-94, partial [Tanacetum coccineum]